MNLNIVNRLIDLCYFTNYFIDEGDGNSFSIWNFPIYKEETKEFKDYVLMKHYREEDNKITWELFTDDDSGISCDYNNAVNFNEIDSWIEGHGHNFHPRNKELEDLLEKYAVDMYNRKEMYL